MEESEESDRWSVGEELIILADKVWTWKREYLEK